MVTYADLFAFVVMLCAVITLVVVLLDRKNKPTLLLGDTGRLKSYTRS